jgi:uracil phosphoribosyltransferase
MASTAAVAGAPEVSATLAFHTRTDLMRNFPTLTLVPLNAWTLSLHTQLRDARADTATFVRTADLLLRNLLEHALASLPATPLDAITPTASAFHGCSLPISDIVGVSIVRAGESFELVLRQLLPAVSIGKLLIQRDETQASKRAVFLYAKLPPGCQNNKHILLMDPMLASGGSAICAVQKLVSHGIALERITFVNLISSPEGLTALFDAFPTLRVVSGCCDPSIDDRKFILPGVGDFGDRYYGSVGHDGTDSEHNGVANR